MLFHACSKLSLISGCDGFSLSQIFMLFPIMCAKAHGFAWILFIMDLDYSWTYYVFHCIDSHTLSITIPSWNLWFEPGNHQIGSTMENIPSKGVSFSDFLCTFAMSFRVLSVCFATLRHVKFLIWQIVGQLFVVSILVKSFNYNDAEIW